MKTKKAVIYAIFGVLTVLVGFGTLEAWFFLRPSVEGYFHREDFDQESWKNPDRTGDWPTRLRMVDDLLEKHSLKGMSQSEISDLLGESDKTQYFQNYDMVYWLGPERGAVRIDSEWLVLRFDSEDVCSEVRIVRD